jgi:hypothetical protein
MSVSLNRLSTTIVAVAVIAAALGLGSALGATPPTGMSAQEYKALVIRGQALNDLYGAPEVTSQYKAMVRADRIRGEAMNRLAKSGVLTAAPVPSETVAGGGFDWTDFAIGSERCSASSCSQALLQAQRCTHDAGTRAHAA